MSAAVRTQRREVGLPLRLGEIGLGHLNFDLQSAWLPLDGPLAGQTVDPVRLPTLDGAQGWQIKGALVPDGRTGLYRRDGWLHYVYSTYDRYHFDFREGQDAWRARFSSKALYNLRRQRRIYFEQAGCAPGIEVARTPEEVDRFHRRARALSTKTYQERLLQAGLPDGDDYREALVRAAAAGEVRGYLLPGPGGDPTAYVLCRIEGGDVTLKYVGFDPEHGRLSPGSTLLLMAIESLFEEGGLRYFDFEEGAAQYKKQFSTGCTPCGNLLVLRDTWGHRARLEVHRALSAAGAAAVRLADRLGIKDRLKRALRRGRSAG